MRAALIFRASVLHGNSGTLLQIIQQQHLCTRRSAFSSASLLFLWLMNAAASKDFFYFNEQRQPAVL